MWNESDLTKHFERPQKMYVLRTVSVAHVTNVDTGFVCNMSIFM